MTEKKSKTKLVILILLILLLLSIGALAARLVYLYTHLGGGSSVVVPDNLIGTSPSSPSSAPTVPPSGATVPSTDATVPSMGATVPSVGESVSTQPATEPSETRPSTGGDQEQQYALSLTLHKNQLTDNARFETGNMLPGDTLTQYFCLKASHRERITVYFSAPITEQTKQLADVLHIRVSNLSTGDVLYSGTFADMRSREFGDPFDTSVDGETVVYYKVQVQLPTSAGNAHQNATLKADLQWRVEEDHMLPPPTGDRGSMTLWLLLLAGSAVALIIMIQRRRKGADNA